MSQCRVDLIILLIAFSLLQGCAGLTRSVPSSGSETSQVGTTDVEPPVHGSAQAKTDKHKRERIERMEPSVGLQLGAFKKPESASSLVNNLKSQYPIVFESRVPIVRAIERDGTKLYRVILGPFSDEQMGLAFCKLLRQHGEACFLTLFDRFDLRVERVTDNKDTQ